MYNNGNYFFYFIRLINYNIFEFIISSKKAKVTKRSKQIQQNEMQNREQKVKLRNELSLYF